MPRRLIALGSAALLLTAGVSEAQERGGFITTIGRDTIAMERFEWLAGRTALSGEAVVTTPRVQRYRYDVKVGADGRPTEIEYVITLPTDTAPPLRIRTVVGRDSVRFARSRGARVTSQAARAVDAAVFPENLYLWALYELSTRAVAPTLKDSARVMMVSPGGPTPYEKVFRRRAADTLSTMFFFPQFWMNYVVDASGALRGIDGSNTTIKVRVSRQTDVPLEAFAERSTARERSAGAVGDLSPADSVATSLGTARISVAYSRPAMRGRRIWGGVVPLGAVWRTGANAATRLHLSQATEIGGTRVSAGSYSLFTIPGDSAATLIINTQVGQWGTEYHQDRDLIRVPMRVTRLPGSSERFTIGFSDVDGASGTLFLEWDRLRWSVPLRALPEAASQSVAGKRPHRRR